MSATFKHVGLTVPRYEWAGSTAYAGAGGNTSQGLPTHFTQVFLRHLTTRACIEVVFRAVHNEVMAATNSLMRPSMELRLKRELVLVDRGGAPPPFVPQQYSMVPHHVVAREWTVTRIREAFALGARGSR